MKQITPAALLLALALAPVAAMGEDNPYTICGDAKAPNATVIDVCTKLIKSYGKLDSGAGWMFDARGKAYSAKGDDVRAIQDYDMAVKLYPTYDWGFADRGNSNLNLKRYDAAIADFTHAIAIRPKTYYYNSRCWVRAVQGKAFDLAMADCNKALDFTPGDPSTLDTRALLNYRMANYSAAISDATSSIAADPNTASSLYIRGLAKQKLGDTTGAATDIAAAKALQPTIAEDFAAYGVGP